MLFIIAAAVIENYEQRPNYSRNQLVCESNQNNEKNISFAIEQTDLIMFLLVVYKCMGRDGSYNW